MNKLTLRDLGVSSSSSKNLAHLVMSGCCRYVAQVLAQPVRWIADMWKNWWRATEKAETTNKRNKSTTIVSHSGGNISRVAAWIL
ncbi:hypothetical protein PoB_005592400 [Plakobranchus ocellatus]|uniref:Uncharacterized protein n=1 Tax=Plakobranchus ocellatus TaxID=259542 RepID=A0AAV4CA30_9GAST|nr:hypothetical protein PoB_005592400 [Plakobranchus ocellatus]